jgi:hypothetical protein
MENSKKDVKNVALVVTQPTIVVKEISNDIVTTGDGKATDEDLNESFEKAKKLIQNDSSVKKVGKTPAPVKNPRGRKPKQVQSETIIVTEPEPEVVDEISAPEVETQLEKFKGFRAELAMIETLAEMKFLENKAAAAAVFARRNKIGLDEQNEWGKFRIDIEAKKGEWLNKNFPNGGDKKSKNKKSESHGATLKSEGITKTESAKARLVNDNPELAKKVMTDIENVGKIITPNAVTTGIKAIIKKESKKPDTKEPKKGNGHDSDSLYKVTVKSAKETAKLIRTARKSIRDEEAKLAPARKTYVDDIAKLQEIEDGIQSNIKRIKDGLANDLLEKKNK